jgi:hypothetical protein
MTGSSHPGCRASSQAGEQRHLSEHTYVAHKRVNFTDDETRRKRLRHVDEPLTADTETDFPVVDLEVA